MKRDIATRWDIEIVVNRFYERVKEDNLLAPVFADLDWPKHLPVMYNFWASMMLGDQSYTGNPFQKHVHLLIGREHFLRWLELFTVTLDENFSGEKTEEMKNRANSIALLFQHKLGLISR